MVKHDCGASQTICSNKGFVREIIELHPVILYWKHMDWSESFHDEFYESGEMAHTHTAQGRAEHVRAVSEWLGKAHARHHHKMFERRKQLAEFRYHDIRRQMLERAEWDAKADAEQAAAEEEIPDEGAKVEL